VWKEPATAQKESQQRKTTILNQDHSQNIIPTSYQSNTKHTCHPLKPWHSVYSRAYNMKPKGQMRSS